MNKLLTTTMLTFALIAIALLIVPGCETTKFDKQAHGSDSAVSSQASKYWKKEGWWSLKEKSGKVMITEFSVEYITETELDLDQNQLGLMMVLDVAGVGDSKREYDENFKREFPAQMYAQFVQALESQGFSVIPMSTVTKHAGFGKIAGASAGADAGGSERNWGPMRSHEYDKYSVYPTPGLPTVDDSWFKGIGNAQAEMKVAGELGADIALRVRIRCGVDDDGYAMLAKGSRIRMMWDFQSSKTGMGTSWYAQGNGLVLGTHGFLNNTKVATSEDFRAFEGEIYKVDTARFGRDILEMFPTYAKMGVVTMKK